MLPPANSPLLVSSRRSGILAGGLPLDVLFEIFFAEASIRHEKSCPSAFHFDPEFDEEEEANRVAPTRCNLRHCPHETSPTYTLTHVCQKWRSTTTNAALWSRMRLRVAMEFNDQPDVANLQVYNLLEYEFCATHSADSWFMLSIGCDPQQKEDMLEGKPIVKRRMMLDVGGVLSRLSSICFDGDNGRLMAALGLMQAPNVTDVYILGGASDARCASHMYMVRDALYMASGKVERVYCSFEFDYRSGPLTFASGYENFQVLDLSSSASYHEEAVEWILALATSLIELRIQVSISQSAHPGCFPNGSYIIRGSKHPRTAVSGLRTLRIKQYIGLEQVHLARQAFLSRFSFPHLQELVIQYCHALPYPCNISWLTRESFPALTTLQLTSDAIRHDLLGQILDRMPALLSLAFPADGDREGRTWCMNPRANCQDNTFLRALRRASKTLEVVKVGGDVWFDRYGLMRFLEDRRGLVRSFVIERWYAVFGEEDLQDIKRTVLPVHLDCLHHGRCDFAMTTGTRARGTRPSRFDFWKCTDCRRQHSLREADRVSISDIRVQDLKRTFWAGF